MIEKFTPGPWLAAVSDTHDKRLAIWADGGIVGATQVALLPPEFKAVQANAYLIAAAPDLYEALERLQKHVITHACKWDEAENGSHHHPVWQQVADALAKARGEA